MIYSNDVDIVFMLNYPALPGKTTFSCKTPWKQSLFEYKLYHFLMCSQNISQYDVANMRLSHGQVSYAIRL